MTKNKPNVFITDDIVLDEWISDEYERYEYPIATYSFAEHVDYEQKENGTAKEKANYIVHGTKSDNIETLKDLYPDMYEQWYDNAIGGEREVIPMMYAIRYYPDFVTFDLQKDNDTKVSGNTVLIYDTQKEAYAVGMSGGGMDLSPHLLDTFIKLGHGVPSQLANDIRLDYNAYVNEDVHKQNCKLLAKAFRDKGRAMYGNAKRLELNK